MISRRTIAKDSPSHQCKPHSIFEIRDKRERKDCFEMDRRSHTIAGERNMFRGNPNYIALAETKRERDGDQPM